MFVVLIICARMLGLQVSSASNEQAILNINIPFTSMSLRYRDIYKYGENGGD